MKKLLIITFFLCSYFSAFAQNTAYYDRMEHVFGNIDKTKVTTGFLKEFGIRLNDVEAYNGVLQNTNWVDKTQWQSLYASLYTMRVGTENQNMTAPNLVLRNLRTQKSKGEVLLAAQHYNYQQYKANAYTNGDVTVVNDRIYDVAGKNPYETKTVFAVSPLKQRLQGKTFSFRLPSTLIHTNTDHTLNQVQIDFGNGQGYQTTTLNTGKSVTYTSGGEKEIKVKFIYNNGPTLYSHSKIWVDYVGSNPTMQTRFNNTDVTTYIITGDTWQGSEATGLVTVELAPGHTSLTKPLIVVEGFDPDNSFDYFDLINGTGPGGLFAGLGEGLTLNQAIEDEGYDLVFVNFVNSTDYIQRNAYMVQEVIERVNILKTEAGSTEKNVVLGMSMGGLVARYALRNMEIDNDPNTNHDTKLYISHDAPHQGANVPLAFQALVRHLVGEEVSLPVFFSLLDVDIIDLVELSPDLQDGLALLQTPAARQMLIYQLQDTGDNVSIGNNTLHNNFAAEYSAMGYPQQNGIRNIAIANGSECGTPLNFSPNSTLVNINEKIDLPYFLSNVALAVLNGISLNPGQIISSTLSTDTDIKIQFNAKALPNQESKQIYKGKIFIEKTILFLIDVEEPLIDGKTLNSSSSMLPLDNTGGGIYDLEAFINLPPEMDNYVYEKQFNFIPTYSSLDIGGGNQDIDYLDLVKAYSPLSPPVAPKNSPFDNFYTNPVSSEGHIQFTLNNGKWLIDELSGEEAFYSCASSCAQLELNINGSERFCNSATYSVSNLTNSPEVGVEWSIMPTNAATIAQTGNTISLTKNPSFNGTIILTAIVNTKCENILIERRIWAGRPSVVAKLNNGNYLAHGSSNEVCKSEQIVTNMRIEEATNVNWTLLNSSHTVSWSQQGDNLSFYLWANNHSATFRFTTSNNCGTVSRDFTFNAKDCSGGGEDPCTPISTIARNPVDTEIDIINIPAPCDPYSKDSLKENNSKTNYSSAILYDFYGNRIKSQTPANGKMNVQDLKKGHYILEIKNSGNSKMHHLIIN